MTTPADSDARHEAVRAEIEPIADMLFMFRQSIAALTRSRERITALTEAQIQVSRALVEGGPTTPAALARRLGLAGPTVSNLVRELETKALVTRSASPTDGRSVVVSATDESVRAVAAWRAGRVETVALAFERLSAPDQRLILAAAPSFELLLEALNRTGETTATGVATLTR